MLTLWPQSSFELDVSAWAAAAVIVFVFSAVLVILRPRGWRVQVTACLFITSLVVTQLMMKVLSSPPFNYRFPAAVSVLHFLSVWLCCAVYWAWRKDWTKCGWRSIGTAERYAKTILPIAVSLPLSVILSNRAMLYVGAGVNAVVGTLAPVVTASLSHALGRHLNPVSWAGIGTAWCGALLITWAETVLAQQGDARNPAASGLIFFGLALSFASVLTRSIKAVLQDTLLKPRAYSSGVDADVDKGSSSAAPPMEPMHLWALQSPPCAGVAVLVAVATEDLVAAVTELTTSVASLILCTCCSAAVLNLLGMLCMRDLGASSNQLVGKLNTLVTMALSVALLGETLPNEAIMGTCIVLCGVAIFEYGERRQRAKVQEVKQDELLNA